MSSYAFTTYKVLQDYASGHQWGNASARPTGYVGGLPSPLWAGNEFELIIDHYEYYDTVPANQVVSDFGSTGSTAKLYIIWDNVADAVPTELATGTITEATVAAGYNRITYQVAAGAISSDWASTSKVRIYEEITATGKQRNCYQTLQITDRDGDGSATPAAGDLVDNLFISAAAASDLTAVSTITVYTVPTGYRFVCTRAERIIDAITTPGTPETASWGKSTATEQMLVATAMGAVAANELDTVLPNGGNVFASGEAIVYDITVGATHATATGRPIVHGYLITNAS